MKRYLLLLLLIAFTSIPAYADKSERVRVIKFDEATDDLIIQRIDGERLLLQHNRQCSSMSTEFPVYLIWDGEDLQLKVASNEICKVYNYGPYTGNVKIVKRIRPLNPLTPEHLAEIEWKGKIYEINYEEGCRDLREFVDEEAYLYTRGGTPNGGTLYLPNNQGFCKISTASYQETVEVPEAIQDSPIKNVIFSAENNQVHFFWDPVEADVKWIYLIARSRFQVDPDDYIWKEMPNLRYSATNSFRATRLMNGRPYYFYLSARDYEGNVAPWQEFVVTSKLTRVVFENNPDPEEYEIEVEQTDTSYILTWPNKESNTLRHMIQLFVNGRRTVFKFLPADVTEYTVEKTQKNEGARFKLDLRTIPIKRTGLKYHDSIFWKEVK